MTLNSITAEPNLVKTGAASWVVIDPAHQESLARLAPAIYAELNRRAAAGTWFLTAAGAWQGEEYMMGDGAMMASVMIVKKEIYLHLFTQTVDYGRLHLATRQGRGAYEVHFNLGTWEQFIDQYLPRPVAPRTTAENVAAELVREYGDLGGRIERALELYQAGQVEFEDYHTGYLPGGREVTRACDCPDAMYRAPRVKGIGTACKHTICQLIAYRVETETETVAGRRAVDKIEMRRVHTADLPVWAAQRRHELAEVLG